MAMALKMLPCKKRRAAAAAAGPPSPRERGEDAELPGGSGAAEGGGSARPAGRGPGEASPKSGRKAPVRAAPSPGQELPAGPGSPAAAEGKIPKLYSEVEVSSQRDLDPSENPGPVPESPGRSSLQLSAARNLSTMRPPKNSRAEEQDGEDVERRKRRRKASKRKREVRSQEEEGSLSCDIKLDESLDRTLEDGAKQHNLTVVNVRNILHEVITNEHVVAMVKAAISETEDIPLFEPKMTRSKLKEVVEKGGVIPTWNISPIKKANEVKPPQFVDIPLEEDDSSDEEYQPDDEEEDETAEESLLESDVESTASSPRGAKRCRTRRSSDEEGGTLCEVEAAPPAPVRHISAEVVPMGPPPPPKAKASRDSSFMEKLHAVDEELACSPVCMDAYQPLEDSLIAFRTRSKRPLKDVPLGQLEAELRAPDITPDMYEPSTGDDEEWERWLRGLMNDDVENEDEADDDDDPEYNFLEDLDEPDTEDFRNDRAVRITKKEVNELMEELFETFQGEMGFSSMKDERPEDGDAVTESRPNFNTPQALRFEEPLANLLNKQHQTVKEQLEQLRIKKSSIKAPQETEKSKNQNEKPQHSLVLDTAQRKRLQQQMQQHVQLLTQIHLLASFNPALSSEASTTQMFLSELGSFACSSSLHQAPQNPKFQSMFQPCNLQGALQLLHDFHARVPVECSPRKAGKSANEFSCLPKQVAWILATRKVFMYPELLPICALRANPPRDKIVFTKAEDNLLALGLKHFEGTDFPKPLISKYLLPTKTAHQLTVRIKNLNMNRAPDNIIRHYKRTKQLPVLLRVCEELQPHEWKAPVEREEQRLPFWLKASLPSIQRELKQLAEDAKETPASPAGESALVGAEKETSGGECDEKYPLLMPKGLVLTLKPLGNRFSRRPWRRQRCAALKPVLIRPSPCLQPSSSPLGVPKNQKLPQAEAAPSRVRGRVPRPIQPAPPPLRVPAVLAAGDAVEFQNVLPSGQPSSRQAFPGAVVASEPGGSQPKVMLPALGAMRARRPCVRKGYQRKKGPKSSPVIKAAPVIQPSPVILTVPATTVKVLNIGNGCNVIQPLSTAVGRGAQAIPVTTLLVNPSTFPCPLNQPLVTSSIPSLIVSPSPVGREGEEKLTLLPAPGAFPAVEPKVEPSELFVPCSTLSPKKECGTNPARGDTQDKGNSWAVAEGDGNTSEPLPVVELLPHLENPDASVEIKSEDLSDAPKEASLAQKREILCAERKEEFMLGLGQELNMEAACSCGDEPKKEQIPCEEKAEEQGQAGPCPAQGEQQGEPGGAAGPPGTGDSPRNPQCPAEREAGFSSPPGDSSSIDGLSVGTPAGPEAAGDREGQEEEEEDDFDDFTQDEDEEMSSASEESILSVPELQETMEKLTWLATERRLSQEGDSEEENSQEENSEPEEEEEEEGEGMESSHKEDETCGDPSEELKSAATTAKAASPQVETLRRPAGEALKAPGRSRSSLRSRSRRGRARGSKDTAKLLLLYDEDILDRDPLREQKDLAFAQAYLTRVRETLQHIPGKYEDFLRVIYEFEIGADRRTAVDLYCTLQKLLHDWPQLLTDFAAFLLPEQALECGLFEEQQAFEKSRKFLRQLEICFAENPAHHQKIIKVLQSCADCVPQEIAELKTQMWQLLKGHDHLQDEFSVFFDHLRPSASRMGDFEEINWTEEKEYEFDGFEEVSLPDVEEEEEPPKIHGASRNKKRKEIGGQHHDKEVEWVEGLKECSCPCSCHEGSSDPKLKKSKRRSCSHCGSKVCEGKFYKNKDCQELPASLAQRESSPQPEGKEPGMPREAGEETLESREEAEEPQGRTKAGSRRGESLSPAGSQLEGRLAPSRPCAKPAPADAQLPEGSSAAVGAAKDRDSAASDPRWAQPPKAALKLPQETKGCPRPGALEQPGGDTQGLGRDLWTPGPHPCQPEGLHSDHGGPALAPEGATELEGAGGAEAKQSSSSGCPDTQPRGGSGAAPEARPRSGAGSSSLGQQQQRQVEPRAGAAAPGHREEQQRVTEATVCAKNSKVSSTGEKVVLWTREADRVILTTCQEKGAHLDTFHAISQKLGNKTASEVSHRFRELMRLFHTSCDGSSEDEEDATSTSNTDQLSDKDLLLSEEEPDD
ncbi:GON-4-like protein [Ammospiza maritima maritima]